MSAYDQRQYRLMRGLLEKFEQNKISMQHATGDLGTLLRALEFQIRIGPHDDELVHRRRIK
jgi:hypothetical protein